MKNKVTKDDLIGNIKDFPIEVVQKMIDYQIYHGNIADVTIFQNNPMFNKKHGGFTWDETKEGSRFWDAVIKWKNFDLFFQKYPKSGNSKSKNAEFPLPPEKMRVYIKGNNQRGKEVIKVLTDLGAKNKYNQKGVSENDIYLIDFDGNDYFVTAAWKGTTSYKLVINFYTEIKLPWIPKDKELVWAWNDANKYGRDICFYDSKHNCTFYSGNGHRDGLSFQYYAPYEGEWPEWAKEAVKKLKKD